MNNIDTPAIADVPDPKANTSPGNWIVTGDGNCRHTVRMAISQVPRKVRLEKKEQMTHRKDIAYLRQHPMAGLQDHPEASAIRNAARRQRQERA